MAETVMPRRRAASRSMAALAGPVVTSSRRWGRRSSTSAGNRVRSRIATSTSKPAKAATTASAPAKGSVKTVTSPGRPVQSASSVATPW